VFSNAKIDLPTTCDHWLSAHYYRRIPLGYPECGYYLCSTTILAGSCGVRRSIILLVYSIVSAIGVVSGGLGFLLLLCEDVLRRLKIGISDGAIVAVPATPGTAVISRHLS
jgi:hypothetical protein